MPYSAPSLSLSLAMGNPAAFGLIFCSAIVLWLKSRLHPHQGPRRQKVHTLPQGLRMGPGSVTSSADFRCRTFSSSCCSGRQWLQPNFLMNLTALSGNGWSPGLLCPFRLQGDLPWFSQLPCLEAHLEDLAPCKVKFFF